MSTGREIRLAESPDGQWTARDFDVGVSAQGASRDEALTALDAVVAAGTDEVGHEPAEEEIRELGVDPAALASRECCRTC